MKHQVAEVVTSVPPVGVAGMTLLGYGVADWVQVLAAVWLLVQILYFIWTKMVNKKKDKE